MTRTLVCNCNQSMALDDAFFKKHLPGHDKIYEGLCRQDIGSFIQELARDEDIIVACTQEHELFKAISSNAPKPLLAPIKFVNIRETGGWGRDKKEAQPKIAALLAYANLPAPEPLPTVSYDSTRGRICVLGPGEKVFALAAKLAQDFAVTAIINTPSPLPISKQFMVINAQISHISGYLGKFTVQWHSTNPIQLDLCTRCGACVSACPEGAIDASFQINMDKCKTSQDCVKACGPIGAIQFLQDYPTIEDEFDVVLDLSELPILTMAEPPKGYFAPGPDPIQQAFSIPKIFDAIGEFEKPRFFSYQEKICAHGRNEQIACRACIDVCSTQAITSVFESGKGHVKVDPHLCMGCGACATACPSGAMSYANPTVPYWGLRIKSLVETFMHTSATGLAPTVLLHSGVEGGDAWLNALGRSANIASKNFHGLPAHVIPLAIHHVASTGIELWLAMLTHGVGEIAILASGEQADEYIILLHTQIALATEILEGLGYGARVRLIAVTPNTDPADHLELLALDQACSALQAVTPLMPLANFSLAKEKRETLEMSLEHLLRHAPLALADNAAIPLGAASPLGGIAVNASTCTLCMSCVSACPAGALLDHLEIPQLGFIEKNCVQCGLCATTCPENAVTLIPRLSTIQQRKSRVILNETQAFHCTRCAKPFATEKMMQVMMAKIGSHPAFSGAAQKRLAMCGDCRVIDMMEQQNFN